MDVKQAVQSAKSYVSDLFSEEHVRNLALEEVEFDEPNGVWLVTIGFARPWATTSTLAQVLAPEPRAYKVVRLLDLDGRVISVKDRRVAEAA